MTPVGCPMADLKSKIASSGFRGELRLGEPMANHTTFKIGGPADVFAVPAGEGDLALLAREAQSAGLSLPCRGRRLEPPRQGRRDPGRRRVARPLRRDRTALFQRA